MGLVVSPLTQETTMQNWKAQAAAAIVTHEAPADAAPAFPGITPEQLEAAGREFAARCSTRIDSFAANSSQAAFDIAHKLRRYRSFASPKQAEYAAKLLKWANISTDCTSQQEVAQAPVWDHPAQQPEPPPAKLYPNICGVVNLSKFARFTIGQLQLSLKNDGTVIWIKWDGRIVGSIDSATHALRTTRRYATQYAIDQAVIQLDRAETDPLAAARENGVLTGRCSCCGRPLTDPTSISYGIGPVCREKGFGVML
jgi:hypothetical protein